MSEQDITELKEVFGEDILTAVSRFRELLSIYIDSLEGDIESTLKSSIRITARKSLKNIKSKLKIASVNDIAAVLKLHDGDFIEKSNQRNPEDADILLFAQDLLRDNQITRKEYFSARKMLRYNYKTNPLSFIKGEISKLDAEIKKGRYLTREVTSQKGIESKSSSVSISQKPKNFDQIVCELQNSRVKPSNFELKLGAISARVENICNSGVIRNTHIDEFQNMLNRLGEFTLDPNDTDLYAQISALNLRINDLLSQGVTKSQILPSISEEQDDIIVLPQGPGVEISESYIQYIDTLLLMLHDVTSTRGNSYLEKISSGDGTVRQDALRPLLAGLQECIRRGRIDVLSFSWRDVITITDIENPQGFWKTLRFIALGMNENTDFTGNILILQEILEIFSKKTSLPIRVLQDTLQSFLEKFPSPQR